MCNDAYRLISKGSELFERGGSIDDGLLTELDGSDFSFVVGLGLDLPLLFQTVDDILVTPTDLVRQALDGAVLATRLQPQNPQSFWDDHLLLSVVRWGNTLKEFKAFNCGSATGGLVGQHPADGLEENARWRAVMEGSRLLGVDNVALVQEVMVPQLVPEEAAADINLLASDHNDLLPRESLFGDNRRQTTQQVPFAVNDDRGRRERGHFEGGRRS